MNGFRKVFDGTLLLGETILSIISAVNVVSVAFTGHKTVSVLGPLEFSLKEDRELRNVQPPLSGPDADTLEHLAGRVVIAVALLSDSCLELEFDDATRIRLIDDSKVYESVVVTAGDRTIVV